MSAGLREATTKRFALRAGILVVAALALSTPDGNATPRHRAPTHGHRPNVVRPRFAPAIPSFDPIEADVEVHEIAPYRSYPYYPDFYRTPYPYPYTPW